LDGCSGARRPAGRSRGDHRSHRPQDEVACLREEVSVSARELLDVRIPEGTVTEGGLRNNVSVGLQYLGEEFMEFLTLPAYERLD
jgi:hypothetical protein